MPTVTANGITIYYEISGEGEPLVLVAGLATALAFARQREASRTYDVSDRLHEIRVPTLILHGKTDRSVPYTFAEEMQAGILGSRLIAFSGGHLFAFFQRDQFVSSVVAFLDSQRA